MYSVIIGNLTISRARLFEPIMELYPSIRFISSTFTFFSCGRVSEEVGAQKYRSKYRVDIYIGGDNDSRKIRDGYLDKVRKWANATFPDGYTLVRGEGYYDGTSEDSILLHAFLDYDVSLKRRLQRLKRELKQESILYVKSPVDYELV